MTNASRLSSFVIFFSMLTVVACLPAKQSSSSVKAGETDPSAPVDGDTVIDADSEETLVMIIEQAAASAGDTSTVDTTSNVDANDPANDPTLASANQNAGDQLAQNEVQGEQAFFLQGTSHAAYNGGLIRVGNTARSVWLSLGESLGISKTRDIRMECTATCGSGAQVTGYGYGTANFRAPRPTTGYVGAAQYNYAQVQDLGTLSGVLNSSRDAAIRDAQSRCEAQGSVVSNWTGCLSYSN